MHYHFSKSAELTTQTTLVLGILANQPLDISIPFINKHQTVLTRLVNSLQEAGDIAWQSELDNQAILIIHCGESLDYTANTLKKHLQAATSLLLKNKITNALFCFPELTARTPDWQLEFMLLQIDAACYQCLDYKTQVKTAFTLQNVSFYLPKAKHEIITSATAIAQGIKFAKDLANAPANICTPTYLAEEAQKLSDQETSLRVNCYGRSQLENLGMGALLAVSKGSIEEPKLIEIHYNGGGETQPIVLIGKGITFDSGGISLKPPAHMNEMKYDMSGAASVLGTLKACASLKLPINVIGIMACAENMPSGCAVKPGDIIKSAAGMTIEITNTDAEGRLVLADALHHAKQFNPYFVVDIATLTGAIIVALGNVHSGLMSNDDDLAGWVKRASEESQDTTWQLPLDDAYQTDLDSPLADMVNSTETRDAGSITAACFLSRFIKGTRWAHLDIAGTAWNSGKNNAATGRPVALLITLLRQTIHAR